MKTSGCFRAFGVFAGKPYLYSNDAFSPFLFGHVESADTFRKRAFVGASKILDRKTMPIYRGWSRTDTFKKPSVRTEHFRLR